MGSYSIEIPIGSVKVEVSHVGFVNKTLNLDLKKDVSLSFVLEDSNFELKEVVIKNEQKKPLTIALGGKLSFNPQKLGNIPSLTGTPDIIKLLQLTPGVQNSGDGNSYIYVRGGDPGHNLMLYSDATSLWHGSLIRRFSFL